MVKNLPGAPCIFLQSEKEGTRFIILSQPGQQSRRPLHTSYYYYSHEAHQAQARQKSFTSHFLSSFYETRLSFSELIRPRVLVLVRDSRATYQPEHITVFCPFFISIKPHSTLSVLRIFVHFLNMKSNNLCTLNRKLVKLQCRKKNFK